MSTESKYLEETDIREGFKKKKVKFGLLAEIGGGGGSERGPRAQPCYQVFLARATSLYKSLFCMLVSPLVR